MFHMENVITGKKENFYEEEIEAAIRVLKKEYEKTIGMNEDMNMIQFLVKLKRVSKK